MNYFKTYKKDFAILFLVIAVGLIAVMGGHFADAARGKAAWTFWAVAQVLCIVLAVGFWIWAWNSQDKGRNEP